MTTTLTPLAAAFTRIAALINDEDLPEAAVTVQSNGMLIAVNATNSALPENTVRRWAQAVDAIVEERPHEWQGVAARYLTATRVLNGIYWSVYAFIAIEATA